MYNKKVKPLINSKTTKLVCAEKVFEYINCRANHLNILVCKQNETIELSQEDMTTMLDSLGDEANCIYTKQYDACITNIYTPVKNYKLIDDSREIINEFEESNNLLDNRMSYDPLTDDRNTFINKYVINGVHYNGCVDFDDYENTAENQIDMEKAYFNFDKCPLYDSDNAFLSRASYYSSNITTDHALNNVGFYRIDNISYEYVSENTYNILDRLSADTLYKEDHIYPHVDLKFMRSVGITFNIVDGVFGLPMSLKFGEDMKRKFRNGKEGEGVGLYSSWVGLQNSTKPKTHIFFKGEEKFLEMLKYDIENVNGQIDLTSCDNIAKVSYMKNTVKHRSHISGYIVAYQRVSTLLQLLNFKVENIKRVCCDAVFYNGPTPELVSTFRTQPSSELNGGSWREFISNFDQIEGGLYGDNSFTKPNKSILYTGAGGTGKTFLNLNNSNYLNIGYLAHSNKLCRATKAEYGDKASLYAPYHWILQDNPRLNKRVLECDILVIDEASTIKETDIIKIMKKTKGIPLIFMGDLTHQCAPIDPPKQWINKEGVNIVYTPKKYNVNNILKLFDSIIHLTHNYRFSSCSKQQKVAGGIRQAMTENISIEDLMARTLKTYQYATEDEVLKMLKYNDLLLSSCHINKNKLNNKISSILPPKYFITKSSGKYLKGEIYEKEPTLSKGCYEVRYCQTIASVQGETLTDDQRLFIDCREMFSTRTLYTAISRAKRYDQIYFFN
jgi:hypothetical protein